MANTQVNPNRLIIDKKIEAINTSSLNINFRFVTNDAAETPVAPSSVRVYVYVAGENTIVNSRDGSDSTGLTVSDTNLVNFDMSPADNTIVGPATGGYEEHRVLFEVMSNADADKHWREYVVQLLPLPITTL